MNQKTKVPSAGCFKTVGLLMCATGCLLSSVFLYSDFLLDSSNFEAKLH